LVWFCILFFFIQWCFFIYLNNYIQTHLLFFEEIYKHILCNVTSCVYLYLSYFLSPTIYTHFENTCIWMTPFSLIEWTTPTSQFWIQDTFLFLILLVWLWSTIQKMDEPRMITTLIGYNYKQLRNFVWEIFLSTSSTAGYSGFSKIEIFEWTSWYGRTWGPW